MPLIFILSFTSAEEWGEKTQWTQWDRKQQQPAAPQPNELH